MHYVKTRVHSESLAVFSYTAVEGGQAKIVLCFAVWISHLDVRHQQSDLVNSNSWLFHGFQVPPVDLLCCERQLIICCSDLSGVSPVLLEEFANVALFSNGRVDVEA